MLTLMGVTMKRRAKRPHLQGLQGRVVTRVRRLEAANLKRYAVVAADADAAYWAFEVPTLIDALCAER